MSDTPTDRQSVEEIARTLDHHSIQKYGANSVEAATLRALLAERDALKAETIKWETAYSDATRKLQAALYIDGVKDIIDRINKETDQ